MWKRAQLKQNAKVVLRKYYWPAFGVFLVAWLLGGQGLYLLNSITNLVQQRSFFTNGSFGWDQFYNNFDQGVHVSYNAPELFAGIFAVILGIIFIVFMFALAFALCYMLFLSNPIEAGMKNFFLQARADRGLFRDLWGSFRSKRYAGITKAMAWRYLFIQLWGLLALAAVPAIFLLVPLDGSQGIVPFGWAMAIVYALALLLCIPAWIKAISYMMVPYIISENPQIHHRRALKLSMQMTYGHKRRIFVLGLSFLGWGVLGLLACFGVGLLFLMPYVHATFAELYITLRNEAIEKGICTYQELGLILAEPSTSPHEETPSEETPVQPELPTEPDVLPDPETPVEPETTPAE